MQSRASLVISDSSSSSSSSPSWWYARAKLTSVMLTRRPSSTVTNHGQSGPPHPVSMVTTLAKTPPSVGARTKSHRRRHDAPSTATTTTTHRNASAVSRKFSFFQSKSVKLYSLLRPYVHVHHFHYHHPHLTITPSMFHSGLKAPVQLIFSTTVFLPPAGLTSCTSRLFFGCILLISFFSFFSVFITAPFYSDVVCYIKLASVTSGTHIKSQNVAS